ncbi:hypothetical protein ACLBR5_10040 [Escherichia coli]
MRPGLLWLANSVCTLLTICAPIGIADVAAGEGALQVWIVRAVVVTEQKIVNQLAVRRYCLRPHTGGPGLEIA